MPRLRVYLAILIVCVAASSLRGVLSAQSTASSPASPQRQSSSDVDRLEAIRMCAEQARTVGPRLIDWQKKEEQKLGIPVESNKDTRIEWEFSGHFNAEMKRCFVEITDSMVEIGTGRSLRSWRVYDAFEGQLIGRMSALKRYGNVPEALDVCEVFGEDVAEPVFRALMKK